jgi:hypothetical protein
VKFGNVTLSFAQFISLMTKWLINPSSGLAPAGNRDLIIGAW